MKLLAYAGLCLLALSSVMTSCNKDKDEFEPPTPFQPTPNPDNQDPDNEDPGQEPSQNFTDLSAPGMANCYIVTQPGNYKFKADNQFNLGADLPVPPQIDPKGASLIWQTVKGSVKDINLENGYIKFEVASTGGNALIAALDEEGNVVWSWHIWMPQEEVKGVKLESGYESMNMNLGAMNNTPGDAASYGMLYQWGRKDPFPAAATLTGTTATVSAPMYDENGQEVKIANSSWTDTDANTLEYSIANPTVCLSNYAQFASSHDWLREGLSVDNLWGNPDGDFRDEVDYTYPTGKKTCYDPCPLGWRVGPADTFHEFTTLGGYAWDAEDFNVADINRDGVVNIEDYNYGWHFNVADGEILYFPAAARFDGSYAMLMGSMSGLWGNYWSNAPYNKVSGGGYCALSFQVKDMNGNEMISISPAAGSSRADAFSIRPIRDN